VPTIGALCIAGAVVHPCPLPGRHALGSRARRRLELTKPDTWPPTRSLPLAGGC
jgi:hypothetical protein